MNWHAIAETGFTLVATTVYGIGCDIRRHWPAIVRALRHPH